MVTWDYTYRIEYHRVLGTDQRALEHVERVEDAGFCMGRDGMTRQEWLTNYTRTCAMDYLERMQIPPGDWLVIVYPDTEKSALCSIRMRNDHA
jgi:hypothetical protein